MGNKMEKAIYCKRCKLYVSEKDFYSNNSLENQAKGVFKAKDKFCGKCRTYLTRKSQLINKYKKLDPNPYDYWMNITNPNRNFAFFNDYFPNYSDFNELKALEDIGEGICIHFLTIPKNQWNYYIKSFNFSFIFPLYQIQWRIRFADYLVSKFEKPDIASKFADFLTKSFIEETLFKYRSIRHLVVPVQTCIKCGFEKSTFAEAQNEVLYKELFQTGNNYPAITLTNFERSYTTKTGYAGICLDCRFNPVKEKIDEN